MTAQADLARSFDAMHVPGDPLILVNVWDAISAKVVASAPGVRAIATASHAVSASRMACPTAKGLDVDTALSVRRARGALGQAAGHDRLRAGLRG